MKWRRIWSLVKKDMREFAKSKYVLSVIIFMPLLFALLFPFTSVLPIAKIDPSEFENGAYGQFVDSLFNKIIDNWEALHPQTQTLIILSYSMFIAVLLLPIIIPAVTASETVVGEKERKTIEAILASPMSESEIVIGKIISSFLPSVIGTLVAAITYMICIDVMLYPFLGFVLFPDLLSMVFVFIISPLISIISVELMIMVSTRVTSVRDAYQIGSLVVLPLIMLIVLEMLGLLLNSIATLLGSIAVLIIIIVGLFKIAAGIFDRERAIIKMV
ncbi:MAG: ABC transporter permease subunit [Candidatus Heimdallarchaeota archaeon]|nr:ABC transporter permease subunit [Candidatus Heimdallarchaeota archaeon]MCK4876060.1 ABC transporter permease subunit [Candidatus Heimdallarchaeota archaeon]